MPGSILSSIEAAEPARDTGILFGKLPRLLVELLQFELVVVEEFPVHACVGSRVSAILPELISSSATKSTATSTGEKNISPGHGKAHLLVDVVADDLLFDGDGFGIDARFMVAQRRKQLVADVVDADLVAGQVRHVRQPVVEHGIADIGQLLEIDDRTEVDRVEQVDEVDRQVALQRDFVAAPLLRLAALDHALAVDDPGRMLLGVTLLERIAEGRHQAGPGTGRHPCLCA